MAIAQAAVGGSGRLLTRQTGAVLNPNMQLLFKQPQLRPFQFTFQLTPRDKQEALTVMQIIRLFKQAMAPIRSDSMLFLKSPHTFKLTYLHQEKDHPYIGSIKECALISCGVDYTPDENYSTYDDGVMTSYSLALAFKEIGLHRFEPFIVIDPKFYRPAEVDFLNGIPEKANEMLGWKPKISFEELVQRMVWGDLSVQTRLA